MNLCLSLAESSAQEVARKVEFYSARVPFLEVRLDYLSGGELPRLPRRGAEARIATCRPLRAGGRFKGSEGERLALLERAARAGFGWIDLEHDVESLPTLPRDVRLLRSRHFWDGYPEDLDGVLASLRALPGDRFKLALMVQTTREVVDLLRWMERLDLGGEGTILGMGPLGTPSRWLGESLGCCWSYLAEDAGRRLAPGQATLGEARAWRDVEVSPGTPIYGLLGHPLEHSLSPLLHNQLLLEYGLEGIYLPFLLDEVECWLEYCSGSRLPFRGFSVTLPFKERAASWCRGGRAAAPINTLVRSGAGWRALNTDREGFLRPLEEHLGRISTAVVVGHGGVAATVVEALGAKGVEVTVLGRAAERVAPFARRHQCAWQTLEDFQGTADLCVNATPVGQFPQTDRSPLQRHQLRFRLVYDLVYHPRQTRLLEQARACGLETLSGIEMFLEQAALQFQAWTGIDPDRRRMRQCLDAPGSVAQADVS